LRYHLERGNPGESEQFYDIAKAICFSLKSAVTESATQTQPVIASLSKRIDHQLTEIFHHSGSAATVTNKPTEALSCFQTYNSLVNDEFATNPSGVGMRLAISWNELGVAHMMNQQWQKGEECCLKAIEIMRSLENLPQTMLSFPLVNLGLAYWLMGRVEESLSVLLEGLSDREAAYGLNDRESFM
jgi:tetratricopeptide (TPR) repeat protein